MNCRMLSTRNWVLTEASNSRRSGLDAKIFAERETMYSGKFQRAIRARMMVVSDFSVHRVER